jgi:hypothetical protein
MTIFRHSPNGESGVRKLYKLLVAVQRRNPSLGKACSSNVSDILPCLRQGLVLEGCRKVLQITRCKLFAFVSHPKKPN